MLNVVKSNFIGFFTFLRDIIAGRKLIFDLTKKDLKVRYLGSYLGVLWAFIQPAVQILILWFVFQVGFRSSNVSNVPFILWLSSGMIPWFFLSEGIANGTNSILDNSFLVKKVVFRVSVLPIVKILSSFFVHLFFIGMLILMFLSYGFYPSIHWLNLIYYTLSALFLLLGISFISSSVVIFFRDFGQFITLAVQLLFWFTPILWATNLVPAKFILIMKLNPIFYIIDGYRDTFIYHTGILAHPLWLSIFWIEAISIFIIGAIIFKRLRPHFADVI